MQQRTSSLSELGYLNLFRLKRPTVILRILMTAENNQDLILIVGSTGDLGGTITRTLLTRGKNVRILVRPQSNYQPLVQQGAQAILGDLKNPASLNEACKGVQFLITTATADKTWRSRYCDNGGS